MIQQNQRFFNIVLILIDMLIITLAFMLAWFIRFKTDLLGFGQSSWGFTHYMMPLGVILPIYIGLYYLTGLYSPQRAKRTNTDESVNLIKINLVGIFIVVTLLFTFNLTDFSRFLLGMFVIFSTAFAIAERSMFRQLLKFIRSKGYNIKHILVVGAGELGEKFARKIKQNSYVGYHIIGFLDDHLEKGQKIAGIPIIGDTNDLEEIILNKELDRIIITISPRHFKILDHLVDTCEKHGVKAEIVPDYYRYFPAKPSIDMIDDIPIINIRYVPLDNSFNSALKRIFDVFLAVIGLVIFSPILIFTTIMVKISSPGPIIFQQERVGRHRKNFNMYKFRSMKVQDEDHEKFQWTTEDDPRKTKFGTFIRKTSIDELPQIFNILKGDMSLIGPRPERPQFVEQFREEIPKYMVKHHVRPGMTGWAQVHGWRGNTSIPKRIEHDIYYVENWTMSLDFKIFLLTFYKGFTDKNAY
ncbi:undecaprenyl-phosphate glucose phosphotransferase [Methanobacterium alcaliphilum]|uniref:undecaprenyl-phosphate glucose phosphotransferase n=1 Tax=Methanobacterium alcaliphilum TaxID=392018 RepID=UPI002009F910|nr:undecaprenyl-phosphate glucose phosphotransferase [Methanobacterium alcaliphilum]MCK9152247.1 undecaprenyl-phosphate glucose phosphotransferase [Methanobacterium alcaliphilum]